jgi:hypothetical protein
MTQQPKFVLTTITLTVILLFGSACGSISKNVDSISLTLTPMSASVKGTATANAGNASSSDELATAVSRATSQAGNIYATQTALGALNEPSRLATATAIAPVVAELPRYGIDPSQGYVAWLHNPVTIDLQGYQQTGYANDFQNITASDFVMAADITWNTFNSTSGCGFMFRSNADTNQPSQYVILITRVASGHLAFLGMADGKIANFRTFYPKDEDKSFSWFNDATNRLAVVARGKTIDLYTNGVLIGQVDVSQPPTAMIPPPPAFDLPSGATDAQVQDYNNQISELNNGIGELNAQLSQALQNFTTSNVILTEGFLGFVGMSQSGSMVCKYTNAWLFIIER